MLFITLEGPDGAGKSTQATLLAERLRAAGLTVQLTREPGGTPLGEHVRRLLLDVGEEERDPLSDALLFNAARRQLVREVIGPALERGEAVVCDRFSDSTLAYQGYGAGASRDALRALAAVATGELRPARTLLFDLSADDALARRARGPRAELTRFELAAAHDREFHRRVRAGYLELAAAEPERWRVIDASAEPPAVAAAAWESVVDLVPSSAGPRTRVESAG